MRTLTLNLPADEMECIEQMCEQKGLTKTQIIRQSLRLYNTVGSRMMQGDRVFEDNRIKTSQEIIMIKKGTTEDIYNEFKRRFPESIYGDEAEHQFKKYVDSLEDTYLDDVQDTEGVPSLPTLEKKGVQLIISHLSQILKKLIRKV